MSYVKQDNVVFDNLIEKSQKKLYTYTVLLNNPIRIIEENKYD